MTSKQVTSLTSRMARSRQRNGLGTNIRVNEQDIRGNRCLEPPFISKPPFKRKFLLGSSQFLQEGVCKLPSGYQRVRSGRTRDQESRKSWRFCCVQMPPKQDAKSKLAATEGRRGHQQQRGGPIEEGQP